MTTRTEEDLLGTAEVPADVYYGIHALRAVAFFTCTIPRMNAGKSLIVLSEI